MFGLIREQNRWNFAAFGKHPVSADYITLGSPTPVLTGFNMWMEQGFSLLSAETRQATDLAWEFWAMVPNGKLLIGMMKSSFDRIGREFPFMISGEGRLMETAANWHLMPYACETTWRMYDRLVHLKWSSVKPFSRSLTRIKDPKDIWTEYAMRHERDRSIEISSLKNRKHIDYMNKMNNVDGLSRLDRFSMRVDVGKPGEHMIFAVKLLSLLKTRLKTEPGTVFIGGIGSVKHLFFLKGAPVAGDFPLLWNSAVVENDKDN